MTLSYSQILAAVGTENVPADAPELALPRLDQELRLGVGRDGEGAFVLVGPGQPMAVPRTGVRFRFDPWCELVDTISDLELRDVCVLRFRAAVDDDGTRSAVSAVFAGLIELATASPTMLGQAILAMENLFEAGLRSGLDRSTEIGLAGELLVIANSANATGLTRRWHSGANDPFDFSAQGERLDVKTTTGAQRVHWFSSGQVEKIPGVCTTFVSVILPLVEVGSTVASVFSTISGLSLEDRGRIRSIIIDIAKEPPELITSVTFDLVAACASMLHLAAADVPSPTRNDGVLSMSWEAKLDPGDLSVFSECAFSSILGF